VAAAAGVPVANGMMVNTTPAMVAGIRLAAAIGVIFTEALPFFFRSVRVAELRRLLVPSTALANAGLPADRAL